MRNPILSFPISYYINLVLAFWKNRGPTLRGTSFNVFFFLGFASIHKHAWRRRTHSHTISETAKEGQRKPFNLGPASYQGTKKNTC